MCPELTEAEKPRALRKAGHPFTGMARRSQRGLGPHWDQGPVWTQKSTGPKKQKQAAGRISILQTAFPTRLLNSKALKVKFPFPASPGALGQQFFSQEEKNEDENLFCACLAKAHTSHHSRILWFIRFSISLENKVCCDGRWWQKRDR